MLIFANKQLTQSTAKADGNILKYWSNQISDLMMMLNENSHINMTTIHPVGKFHSNAFNGCQDILLKDKKCQPAG